MPRPVTIAITFPDGPQQLDVFADAVHHALAVSPIIDTLGVFTAFTSAIETQSNLDGDAEDAIVWSMRGCEGPHPCAQAGVGPAGLATLERVKLHAVEGAVAPTREQALRHLRQRLVETIADLDAHVAALAAEVRS